MEGVNRNLYPAGFLALREYLPEFRYFKIAINEIPKQELVKIRNAVATVLERGIEQGIGRGIEQGIEQRDIEIVSKMLENNMNNADIRKITGLSLNKMDQIPKKLKKK